jgi:hypothetical protein
LFVSRLYRGEASQELTMLAERRGMFLRLVDEIERDIRGDDSLEDQLRASLRAA